MIVIDALDVGGTEKHLYDVLPRLDKSKFSISIYTLMYRGDLADKFIENNVSVISFIKNKQTWKSASRLKKFWLLFRSFCRLTKSLIKNKPDIIHFYLPMSYLIGGIAAIIARVKIKIMSRRSLNYYQRERSILKYVGRVLHKYMTVITGNSLAVIDNLKTENISESKLQLIYNGINIERFQNELDRSELRDKLLISNHSLVLITVANLIPYKGHEDLIHALGMISSDMPKDWTLLCVGYDSGIQNKLMLLAERLEIEDNIKFLGLREDIPELLFASDIGLLCSHEEGFSNSLLEYMAAGLPVIVTNVGGNSEAVIDGKTGLIVPPHDIKRLAKAIYTLSINKNLQVSMGKNALIRVKQNFPIEKCVNSYKSLYSRLTVS